MTQWQFVSAFVLCLGGCRWMTGMGRVAAMAAMLPCAVAAWILAVRTVLAAAIVGCIVVLARPAPRPWHRRGALAWAGVAALLLGASVVAFSPAWSRMQDGLERAETLVSQGRTDVAIAVGSGARLMLIRAAWDIGLEHPVFGGGAGWFAARLPQWALVEAVRDRSERPDLEQLLGGPIRNAHSALLHAWVDGGLPGAALLGTLLFGLAWRLWKQSAGAPIAAVALALYSIVLVNVPFGIPTTKAPGALIATCLAISWLGAGAGVRGLACRRGRSAG
jgi:hypothetical protein